MLRKYTNTLALLATLGLAVSCSAQTVFVNTIGDGSNYQNGKELTRTLQVGFESHPASGDFTGVRPTFDNTKNVATGRDGVMQYGTSGVSCAQLLRTDANGNPYLQTGEFGAWIAQPFTAAQSGYVTAIDIIAQDRHSVGYSTELPAAGRKARVYISSSPIPAAGDSYVDIDISAANVGKQVSGSASYIPVNMGQKYYAVVGVGTPGSWNPGSRFYFNINWAWKSVVSDGSRVDDVLYNNDNCNGGFVSIAGRVLGIKLSGVSALPQSSITASAGANGTINPSGTVSVNYGGNQSFAITANAGYAIDDVKVDNVSNAGAISSGAYTFTNVTAAHTIAATFKSIAPPVKPYGVNNKSAYTDNKLTGKAVKTWGIVKAVSPTSFTISDGYITPLTINGTISATTVGKMVVVTGVRNANKSITASSIQ